MPRKQLDVPPAVARNFIRDMRAYFAEKNTIKADAIAAQQLHALREHYSGKPRISDAGDVPADERRSMTVWISIN
jgi:hypothetical protein